MTGSTQSRFRPLIDWFHRWLGRGPGWGLVAALGLTVCILLWASSVPCWYFLPGFCALLFTLGLLAVWLLWVVVALIHARTRWGERQNPRRHWKRWASAPGVVAVGVVLIAAKVPRWATLVLAQPEMRRLAAQVQQNQAPIEGVWAGITRFERVDPVGATGAAFEIDGAGALVVGYWVYLPDPADQAALCNVSTLVCYTLYPLTEDWHELVNDLF